MPCILNTKARRILRYFNKHGFNNVNLTLDIRDEKCLLNERVRLEQHFIDVLKQELKCRFSRSKFWIS